MVDRTNKQGYVVLRSITGVCDWAGLVEGAS